MIFLEYNAICTLMKILKIAQFVKPYICVILYFGTASIIRSDLLYLNDMWYNWNEFVKSIFSGPSIRFLANLITCF